MRGHHWISDPRGWECKQCGRRETSREQLSTPCLVGGRLARYAVAVGRWVKAGRPVRTPAAIRLIYAELCCPCSALDKATEICMVCGCKVLADGHPVRNKVAMATEHCPRRKW